MKQRIRQFPAVFDLMDGDGDIRKFQGGRITPICNSKFPNGNSKIPNECKKYPQKCHEMPGKYPLREKRSARNAPKGVKMEWIGDIKEREREEMNRQEKILKLQRVNLVLTVLNIGLLAGYIIALVLLLTR